ncbi:hypothetical protein [Bradyrhizobium genosp. P]|uniref:hypothetical protein n=1 Tax=Bradyrhizobium genosp. P TaxID=83641 RepID=UPI003CEB2D2D
MIGKDLANETMKDVEILNRLSQQLRNSSDHADDNLFNEVDACIYKDKHDCLSGLGTAADFPAGRFETLDRGNCEFGLFGQVGPRPTKQSSRRFNLPN